MTDQKYLDYLRRFERESLLFGKTRTANRYHDKIRRETPRRETPRRETPRPETPAG
jgi:hypothetical protein